MGEAVIKGVELSIQWAPKSNLLLSASGNITDGEVTEAGITTPQIEGDPLDFVPEYSYSINMNYQFSWSNDIGGVFTVDYNRQGKNSLVARTSGLVEPVVHSESIGFLNANLGAEWNSLSLELFVRNILDEDKLTTAANSKLAPQNRPRTIGMQVNYRF